MISILNPQAISTPELGRLDPKIMLSLILTLFASVYLFISLVFLATNKNGYNHMKHTISELGEVGSPQQKLVSYAVFFVLGSTLLLVAYLVQSYSKPVALLALSIASGYLVAAFFPCDVGSPITGSLRQTIHNLGGGVEYIGGAMAFFLMAETFGQPFQILGLAVAGLAIALSIQAFFTFRGLVQRVAELALFGGLIVSVALSTGVI